MKKTLLLTALIAMFLLSCSISFAALSQITGNWQNTNPYTRGITTLVINGEAKNLKMHAWGKCEPNDCYWGEVEAYAYSPDVSDSLEAKAKSVTATYLSPYSETLVSVKPVGNNTLHAEVFTRFTDNSDRSNYTAFYTFARQLPAVTAKPAPPPVLMPMPTAKEDCVSFNPVTAAIKNINGNWTIVDDNHMMFSFGDKKTEAFQALKIIKEYQMNSSCFIGHPEPSFQYLLVNGDAPEGSVADEDCVVFDPDTIEVKNIEGHWKIVDGNNGLYDFGGNENEARMAFEIIRKYGFTRACFVGQPDPSFKYLRK